MALEAVGDAAKESAVREVRVQLHVRDLQSVDPVQGVFLADFTVTMFWTSHKLMGKKNKDIQWDQHWDPEV